MPPLPSRSGSLRSPRRRRHRRPEHVVLQRQTRASQPLTHHADIQRDHGRPDRPDGDCPLPDRLFRGLSGLLDDDRNGAHVRSKVSLNSRASGTLRSPIADESDDDQNAAEDHERPRADAEQVVGGPREVPGCERWMKARCQRSRAAWFAAAQVLG
jgi:hypothetical protein